MHVTVIRAVCVMVAVALVGVWPAKAAILDGLGAIGTGDSSASGVTYPVILQDNVGLNLGGPGLPYAFGRVNANSASILLPGNQVDQAVAEINAGNVTLVTMTIGDNDYIGVSDLIAAGAISPGVLAGLQQQVAINVGTAIDTLQVAGAAVVSGGFANITHAPAAAAIKANPVFRANLETALADGNVLVRDAALARGVPFINFHDLLTEVYDVGSAELGGVDLILVGSSTDPRYFWQDPFHAGTLVRGVITNLYIQAINEGYGTSIPLLTDLEILTLAGLEDEYVAETFADSYAWGDYVNVIVPEPSALALASGALAVVAAFGLRRGARCRRWGRQLA